MEKAVVAQIWDYQKQKRSPEEQGMNQLSS